MGTIFFQVATLLEGQFRHSTKSTWNHLGHDLHTHTHTHTHMLVYQMWTLTYWVEPWPIGLHSNLLSGSIYLDSFGPIPFRHKLVCLLHFFSECLTLPQLQHKLFNFICSFHSDTNWFCPLHDFSECLTPNGLCWTCFSILEGGRENKNVEGWCGWWGDEKLYRLLL